MKKYFVKFLFVIFCISLFTSCFKDNNDFQKDPLRFVPESAEIILNITNADSFVKQYTTNSVFKALTKEHRNNLLKGFLLLDSVNHLDTAHIVYSETETLNHTTLISRLTNRFEDKNVYTGLIDYKDVSYKTSNSRFATIIDSVYIVSSSEHILQKIIDNHHTKSYFDIASVEKLLSVSNSELSVLVKPNHRFSILPKHYSRLLNDWSLFDIKLDEKSLVLNGTTIDTSSTSFSELKTNYFSSYNVLPMSLDAVSSYSFDNSNLFKTLHLQENDTLPYLNEAEELSLISLNNKKFILLQLFDKDQTDFSGINTNSEYRGNTIYDLPYSITVNSEKIEGNYAIMIDGYLIFGSSIDALHHFSQEYYGRNLIGDNEDFKRTLMLLNSESHQLDIQNASSFINEKSLKSYPFITHQLTYENGFTQINTVISEIKKEDHNGIAEITNVTLDNNFIISPQLVLNHRNGKHEIIIQDEDFNLYLIELSGKVLWKKKLDGKVLGKIKQVDIYKNRKLQYAFCSQNSFYIIDRNGNDVDNFPINFKDDITQPLRVFDYDKNKNYRFTIVQNNDLFILDNKGKRVKGFKYSKGDLITSTPNHYRIGSKDYIVFNTQSSVKILDRTGKTRINVKETILSNNPINGIEVYNGKFVFTDNNGVFYTISTNGKVTKETTLLNKPSVAYGKTTKAILSENKLLINNKNIELPFGSYTPVNIFTEKGTDYITLTNLESNQIYLYNDSGELVKHFPLFGNSEADMKFTKKQKLLSSLGSNNTIIVYGIK